MCGDGLMKFEFTLPVFLFYHTGGVKDPVNFRPFSQPLNQYIFALTA
jgi:hypothetical protein